MYADHSDTCSCMNVAPSLPERIRIDDVGYTTPDVFKRFNLRHTKMLFGE